MTGLSNVREAVDRGEWDVAIDLLEASGEAARSAEALELLALAEYGRGEFEASVSAWEELHTELVSNGDNIEAARAAAMTAMFLMMDTGLMSAVRGWLHRAERLLDGLDEAPADAMIAVVRAYERFMCGDMDAAREQSSLAMELGQRLDVPPALVIGSVCAARVKIFDGHVEEGLDLLDEIGAVLMSGEVDPLTTGMMYCELICAAQGMALHDRASEWTEVMNRWRPGEAIGGISGRCRVHRAEILKISGPCDLAEAEALGACDELRPWMRREFGWPLVELGNIRLRKGDLSGAEEAFLAAHDRAWSPHPGLALLRLEQGDVESASRMIADAIAHPYDIPSKERPPFGNLRLAPLLDAQAEIAAAAGDVDTARRSADSLRTIADSYPSRSLGAGAKLARGRAELLAGNLETAIQECVSAIAAWAEIGAPFEGAVARLVLGEARERSGDVEAARMEWRAAARAFGDFGAERWADRAKRLADGTPEGSPPAAAGESSVGVFRSEGDMREVSRGDDTVLMRDLKGFRYVERLLAEPGREFHVLDLIAVESGALPTRRTIDRDHVGVAAAIDTALPVIDDVARDAYRRRLADVEEDIDEARRLNDIGRLELAERDREYLVAELTSAVGLGGRRRSVGGTAERARTSVTRSIRYSLARLADNHPAVAAHLEQSIHTGMYCVYTPDPFSRISWNTGP